MRTLDLGGRRVGPGAPCFVIAEAGVNHNGNEDTALRLVDAAAAAGADAVKFQTFEPALLAAQGAGLAPYQQAAEPATRSQREMLAGLVLSASAHRALKRRAEERGLLFLSSPFDEPSADLLHALDVAAFKVPSGEVTNHPFLAGLARRGRPLLVSTGMCTLEEVAAAVAVIRQAGDPPLGLLHCVSRYPTPPEDANLRAMDTLRASFEVPVGWSDHTTGLEVALAAVARDACMVEKHLTLDRRLPGPDHRASLEPSELAELVRRVRLVESALGTGAKQPQPGEAEVAAVARKSLHLRAALPRGATLEPGSLLVQRPGTGLSPADLPRVLGRRLRRDLPAGALLTESDLEPPG